MGIEVSGLFIYPIKSLRGLALSEAVVEKRGLQRDRRMMLIDSDGRFLTQREHAKMALFNVALDEQGLKVSVEGSGEIQIPGETTDEHVAATVWNDEVDARAVSADVDRWFTDALGLPCRLVAMVQDSIRPVHPVLSPDGGDEVSFADGEPLLLISEESLEDLNSRLNEPVPMKRFRPNVVVRACRPFEEDEWSTVGIGDAAFRQTRLCGRCIVTTIDTETAVSGPEPLRTMAKYRIRGTHAMFGSKLVPTKLGTISVGDSVAGVFQASK